MDSVESYSPVDPKRNKRRWPVGKQKELELLLDKNDIQILAVQETRFLDKNVTETNDYRIFKGKPAIKIMKGMPILGTAFYIHKRLLNCVTEFKTRSERMSLLTMKYNKKNPNKVEGFLDLLDHKMYKIPKSNEVILLGDFNAQIGRERIHRPIVGEYAAHQRTNRNGMRSITICKNFQMKVMSTFFGKLPRRAKTWISPNPMLGEFQIDHVAISKRNMTEIMNVKIIISKEFDSDHYLSKIKLKFLPNRNHRRGEKINKYNTKLYKKLQKHFRKK
ncbi:uncharacterized protein LOC118442506 [Vespa mandarinia]|uniref:uncharacterized protein LOC118442506 n=1 Tax=Vespa mandarinia TaxID=7446 RepID=UPI0016172C6E|nr:uncharacterized protein LOC118442506 [Vespa mandarinia]